MKFKIDFNRKGNNEYLVLLEAKLEKYEDNVLDYTIELDSLKDLEKLDKTIWDLYINYKYPSYSMIISFNPPTIYLDEDV